MKKVGKSATTKATSTASKKATKQPPKKPSLKAMSVQREPLSAAGENREACKLCGACTGSEKPFGMPRVPEDYTRKLVVVTEGNEDRPALKLLRRLGTKAGYEEGDIALVPATRCAIDDPSMAQIRACRPFLLQALHVLKPKNILAIGANAMRALRNDGQTNVTKNRGKEITIPGL
jgi:hypothetical protein